MEQLWCSIEWTANDRCWHEAANRGCPRIGRDRGQSGQHMLVLSPTGFDPERTSSRYAKLSQIWASGRSHMMRRRAFLGGTLSAVTIASSKAQSTRAVAQ